VAIPATERAVSRPAVPARVGALASARAAAPAHAVGGAAAPAAPADSAVAPPVAGGAAAPAAPARTAPASAQALEAEGHELLDQRSYASAIADLLGAIRSSHQSLDGCIEPASEACLTFAYALYDLGRALRLEGHQSQAIAILSERLRIDNQRETVQRELERARGARA
jgi:tetratricopeptide (TPR) repeat protein